MKLKRGFMILIFIAFILFLFSPVASAIDIRLSKEVYEPGETLQAEISGPILEDIEYNDIIFYSGRTKIPLVYDISRINERYYLYALLPYKERDYKLVIKDIFYKEGGVKIQGTLSKNFSIQSTQDYSLSFTPGFIITKKDFFIKLENKGKEVVVSSIFEATGEKQETKLSEEASKKILFSVSGIKNFTESSVKITAGGQSYSIPVFVLAESESMEEKNISKLAYLKLVPHVKNITVKTDQSNLMKLILVNFGDVNLTDITIDADEQFSGLELSISPKSVSKLQPDEKKEVNISFVATEEEIFVFKIKAEAENATASSFIQIISTSKEIEKQDDQYVEIIDDCVDIKGNICGEEQECKGEEIRTMDGRCCLGECVKEKKGSGKWVGFVLFFVVVAVLVVVFIKIKKQRARPEDVLRKRTEAFEQKSREQEKLLKKK